MPDRQTTEPDAPHRPPRLRVFIDADVLFAGAAAPQEHGSSLVLLRLAELTLIEAITSEQVIVEAERNLAQKIPQSLPVFRLLVSRCLRIVPAPEPAAFIAMQGLADPKDLPILAAAVASDCPFLATFNIRHYQPGSPVVQVLRPGELVLRARERLAQLSHKDTP